MTTSEVPVKRRQRGPTDPDRRGRIARAAIKVIGEQGVNALTHRRVAAAAEVPLGSTTYHFATLDDLIAAALHHAADRSVEQLREWANQLPPDADLAEALADFVMDSVSVKREDTMAEYNLYALALHRPGLRKAAVDWDLALADVLSERTDPVTGRMLGVLLCGLLMQAVLSDEPEDRAQLVTLLRRALDGAAGG
ncbi:TetR/AcrR family transcriptional regulator [Haloechinothrix salitolerans]|uniref:TetR/AcrR family transcriptional regulator n=1 Tax=Haloechinothrix salitolerans TaxID=926830 RepID=A0ABW2C651_9PSEU